MPPEADHVDGRWALITGAGSGIGLATAKRLADDGWNVVAVDLDARGLTLATEQVEARGRRARHLLGDVSDSASVAEMITSLGGLQIDALINNAGVGHAATVAETSEEEWGRMIAVNLTGTFLFCRAVLPGMLAAAAGRIVNIASVGGLVGLRARAGYCASKAGVIGLTRAIAADHAAEGIRANVICPGTVETAWIEKILADAPDREARRAAMAARQLDGRMGAPEEVAAGIAFLASDDARFVNGSVFVMDGGLTAV